MFNYAEQLTALKDIKQIMERSSRFISLSGWSGISAGTCALTGAWFANKILNAGNADTYLVKPGQIHLNMDLIKLTDLIGNRLFVIAALTFIAAFISSFFFIYIRSIKLGLPLWNFAARRLFINVSIPMIAGGVFLLSLINNGSYGFIAPGSLLFYGLALLNGSKYTLREIRHLGYCEILLGVVSCWFISYGIYFWAVGFGLFHIIYGAAMLTKYERNEKD